MAKTTRGTPAHDTTLDPSDDTLDQVLSRGFKFLSGLGELPEARARLEARGYTADVHDAGWRLVDALCGRSSLAPPPVSADHGAVKASTAKVEDWAEVNVPIVEASLLDHPQQRAFLLPPQRRDRAGREDRVQVVSTLLLRMTKLDDDPARRDTRKEDHAVLALLARRGIDVDACQSMRDAIAVIQRGERAEAPAPSAATSSSRAAKLALYRWLSEWTAITRSLVKNRTHLIRMGLAKPAKAKRAAAKQPAPVTG